MAIIDRRAILLEDEPFCAVEALQGRIWRRVVDRVALPEIERRTPSISTKLLAGRTLVHVYAETSPLGYEPAEADLEDVYFCTLAGHIGGTESSRAHAVGG